MLMIVAITCHRLCTDAALTAANGAFDTAVGQVSTSDYSSFSKLCMS
jgi:hypothetical protein